MREAACLCSQVHRWVEGKTGYRFSCTALKSRMVAATPPRHPYLNAFLVNEEFIYWEDVHLGIANDLDDYLIAPVIHSVQEKNPEQIVTTRGDLLEHGRDKRLVPSEMSDSSFANSNMDKFGIESLTANINLPESVILMVGRIPDTYIRIE